MWTTPISWTGTPTATQFNTHLSQNILALQHLKCSQAEDIVKNNSETLEDLTGMVFKVREGETWYFIFTVYYISTATADAKFAIQAPLNSSGRYGYLGSGGTNSGIDTFGTAFGIVTPGSGNDTIAIAGTVIVGADGELQLQAAQNTGTATNTTFYSDSWGIAFRQAS